MAPFYRWSSTVSRLQSHYSFFFTTTSSEFPGTHLINLGRMALQPPSGFEPGTHRLGIQHPKHKAYIL